MLTDEKVKEIVDQIMELRREWPGATEKRKAEIDKEGEALISGYSEKQRAQIFDRLDQEVMLIEMIHGIKDPSMYDADGNYIPASYRD